MELNVPVERPETNGNDLTSTPLASSRKTKNVEPQRAPVRRWGCFMGIAVRPLIRDGQTGAALSLGGRIYFVAYCEQVPGVRCVVFHDAENRFAEFTPKQFEAGPGRAEFDVIFLRVFGTKPPNMPREAWSDIREQVVRLMDEELRI